jgi:ECF sigma factor
MGGDEAGGNVSTLLRTWSNGDQSALERLIPIVYEELYRLAEYYMHRERPGHSLQTTALLKRGLYPPGGLQKDAVAESGPFLCDVGAIDAPDSG